MVENIEKEIKEFVLSQGYIAKLNILDKALEDEEFGFFLAISRILLDAPLSEGGVETETIEKIRKKYYK
jgi:hypothetical protein